MLTTVPIVAKRPCKCSALAKVDCSHGLLEKGNSRPFQNESAAVGNFEVCNQGIQYRVVRRLLSVGGKGEGGVDKIGIIHNRTHSLLLFTAVCLRLITLIYGLLAGIVHSQLVCLLPVGIFDYVTFT